MQFKLSSAAAASATLLAFAAQGSAFVIDVYDSTDCTGGSRSVNVYDNTCATWQGGFSSYVPRVYGGQHQYAYFYVPSNCIDPNVFKRGWADGGDGNFRVGDCYSFGGVGHVVNGIGSQYVIGSP
jgi:hypothetical protein